MADGTPTTETAGQGEQAPRRGRGRPPKHGTAMSDSTRSRAARQTRRDDGFALVALYLSALRTAPRQGAEPEKKSILADAERAARRISPDLAKRIEKEHARIYGPETPSSTI